MKRREFLISAAAVAAAAGSPLGLGAGAKPAEQSKLDRIAIMTLNFQSILKVPDVEDNPNRTLELFDIAEMIADKYGVHKVEFQHYHIPSTEPSYLKELRSHIEKSKSRMTQINLEFSGLNMSAPRQRDRLLAIDLTKAWIDHAAMLGAQRVMINQGAQGGTANVMPTHENKVYGIPTLKTMSDYGKSKGIIVSVETRGGGGGGNVAAAAQEPRGCAGAAVRPCANAAAPPASQRRPPAAPAPPAAPPMPQPEVWALLAEILKAAGASLERRCRRRRRREPGRAAPVPQDAVPVQRRKHAHAGQRTLGSRNSHQVPRARSRVQRAVHDRGGQRPRRHAADLRRRRSDAVRDRRRTLLTVALSAAALAVAAAQDHSGQYSPADVAAGARVYNAMCAACHGPTGAGVGGIDLRRGPLPRAATDAALRAIITSGIPGVRHAVLPSRSERAPSARRLHPRRIRRERERAAVPAGRCGARPGRCSKARQLSELPSRE